MIAEALVEVTTTHRVRHRIHHFQLLAPAQHHAGHAVSAHATALHYGIRSERPPILLQASCSSFRCETQARTQSRKTKGPLRTYWPVKMSRM